MLVNIRGISAVYYIKETKKKYVNNLDLNKITENEVSWKTVKPLLSDKSINTTRIYLINGNKMKTEGTEAANTLNT